MPRVLIVEPEEALRSDLAMAVRRAGYLPDAVASAPEALARLASVSADLVLADVSDPGALSQLDALRSATLGRPIVAMSADPAVEVAIEAMKRGASDFLRKPFPVSALEAALSVAVRSDSSRCDCPRVQTADPAVQQLVREAEAAAATDATIRIVGESGTGKDLLARFVHAHSPRKNGPFVAVNCDALSGSLAEGELFGNESDVSTGA
ncbi:MAG: sigma-54-dependent transcriptional regulator, partial [Myxococcota bacterium]